MPKTRLNDIPRKLRSSLGSDFLAGAVVTLGTGLLFMGLLYLLITIWPAG